ncbi:MAG: trehalose-6-phosphate synthase [Dehalococcoidia bacterium]
MVLRAGPKDDVRRAQFLELCNGFLSRHHLILASNRGPVEHHIGPDGRIEPRKGSGGVVTALSSLTRHVEFTWIASAMGEGDRHIAGANPGLHIKSPLPGQRVNLRYVAMPRRIYHKFYNIFCNPLLWFLQHYMWNSPYNPNLDLTVHDAWLEGYIPVNEAFAQAIVEEAQSLSKPSLVLLHDYHLYLAPGLVRQELPNALIQHFIHIPWPTPRYWQLLPAEMRRALCASLCAADVVGFQTREDMHNFLYCCEEFLPGAVADYSRETVTLEDRRVAARVYPISIDVEEVRRIGSSPRALEYEKKLLPLCNEKTMVRVDRAEPSKNIVRGFKAFGALLSRSPEFHGRVNFLAFLVPSRTHIRQYERYLNEIDQVIQGINSTFGTPDWQPITVFYENNYTQAIAGMRLYDVLLVNSVIDGMNLVAKEGPVVNTKDGVLILSETTGAFKQLCDGALAVAPADIEGTMHAMYQALVMDNEERSRRATFLTQAIEQEDITHWLTCQIEDLQALVS